MKLQAGVLASLQRVGSGFIDFDGRAPRSDAWWFMLVYALGTAAVSVWASPATDPWLILMALPLLSVSVRRMHDVGLSGWWLLVSLTGLGAPLVLFWMAQPGQADNRFGPQIVVR